MHAEEFQGLFDEREDVGSAAQAGLISLFTQSVKPLFTGPRTCLYTFI